MVFKFLNQSSGEDQEHLEHDFGRESSTGQFGCRRKKTVIVEYSSPNIAKPFHIGHGFTTILGESSQEFTQDKDTMWSGSITWAIMALSLAS